MPAADSSSPPDIDFNAEPDPWSAPPKSKKDRNKKKKAAKKYEYSPETEALPTEEASPFDAAVAPSPPLAFEGVDLEDEGPPRDLLMEGVAEAPPVEDNLEDEPIIQHTRDNKLLVHDMMDEPPFVENFQTPPKISPAPSTVTRSPRPAFARPVAPSQSPLSRPLSMNSPPHQYASPRTARSNSSAALPHARRESFPAHNSPRARFVEPVAPPHMAQAHFYGLPGISLFGKQKEQTGSPAGSDGYCCCFDTFTDSGHVPSTKRAKDALLVGSEGGLEVFRVLRNKFEVVGRLEGLRGGVYGAKILPHTELYDELQAVRPLVAVIVHGAMSHDGQTQGKQDTATHYQTTVEVYSLANQEHITTLYKSIPVAIEHPAYGQPPSISAPIGDLVISAQGSFITIASGKSGEIFVFSSAATNANPETQFRCIGKYWTCLQSHLERASSRPASSHLDGSTAKEESYENPRVPLFSLSQRWLAIVSPSSSTHISIQGSPLLSEYNLSPPGLATHGAPPQPPVTCDVAGIDAEGTLTRLTRQAAQNVVRYSQRGIKMGWQGWKELTNPTPQSAQHGRTASREYDQFPPTMAPPEDPRRSSEEPAVISIIDLAALLEVEELKPKNPPNPLTTFALEDGCNFLSFSSNGLRLLSVSRKGEVSTIWDLAQANHGTTKHGRSEAEAEDDSKHGPCVKQVHRIQRNSQSVVIDSAWSREDDFLAVLTTHGTVHLHEVPAHRPSPKRKRRGTVTVPAPEKAEPTVSVSQGMSPPSSNGFLGNIKSGLFQMGTQVSTMRSQNPVSSLGIPTSLAALKEATSTASQAGSRAIAKGLSQGYSAAKGGASDYWHAEDNKIRHKTLTDIENVGSLRWIRRQNETSLAIVCGGTVHLHPVQRIERRKGDVLVSGLKHDRYGKKHFDLPPIRTSSDVSGEKGSRKGDDCAAAGPHGFWSLCQPSGIADDRRNSSMNIKSLSSQANEVETNPPYCPFHVDARVNIFAFEDSMVNSQINLLDDQAETSFHALGHGLQDEETWVFGEPLPPSVRMNTHDNDLDGLYQGTGDYSDTDDELAHQVESRLTVHSASEPGGEQIRINARRSPSKWGDADFEEVNEDDDGDSAVM